MLGTVAGVLDGRCWPNILCCILIGIISVIGELTMPEVKDCRELCQTVCTAASHIMMYLAHYTTTFRLLSRWCRVIFTEHPFMSCIASTLMFIDVKEDMGYMPYAAVTSILYCNILVDRAFLGMSK